ncbi:hypothetical protein [Lysinibacillus sp. NPDC056185]|uniref:DUF7660 family protein n=1 Tax=Lysinibacillus sp. NPDC056185 TaxID=3345739 RepID=UPI0039F1186A
MGFYEKIEQVTTKDQFLEFLNLLTKDFKHNVDEWENKSIDNYLEAIESWIEVMKVSIRTVIYQYQITSIGTS